VIGKPKTHHGGAETRRKAKTNHKGHPFDSLLSLRAGYGTQSKSSITKEPESMASKQQLAVSTLQSAKAKLRYVPTPEKQNPPFRGPRFAVCWTERDGIHYCGCDHKTIAAAMRCLIPDGRTFIRAWDQGVLRSLTDDELEIFLSALAGKALR
jgi:hypothetical protein